MSRESKQGRKNGVEKKSGMYYTSGRRRRNEGRKNKKEIYGRIEFIGME